MKRLLPLLSLLIICSGCAALSAALGIDPKDTKEVFEAGGKTLQAVGALAAGTPFGLYAVAVGAIFMFLAKTIKDKDENGGQDK